MAQLLEVHKLDKLVARVHESLSDPSFRAAFRLDPLQACRATFGPDAMPNEGEYFEALPSGELKIVFPKDGSFMTIELPEDHDYSELSDEMLEMVSGGSTQVCSGNAANCDAGEK